MKLEGFIGAAYKLDSVNVDAQRCVNLYPEIIESQRGKEGSAIYLKGTPGLEKILELGEGPIRCVHVDSIGRTLVVSGNRLYHILPRSEWTFSIVPEPFPTHTVTASTSVSVANDTITIPSHGYETGVPLSISSTGNIPDVDGFLGPKNFYAIVVNANTIKMADSLTLSLSGTSLNLTSTGTGNLTIRPTYRSSVDFINYDTEVDLLNNVILRTAFGSGVKVRVLINGPIPGGLSNGGVYYAIGILDGTGHFSLATSQANVLSNTAVDITSLPSSNLQWTAVEVGSLGIEGGSQVLLGTSSGVVKAASMSFGGDGKDSSTIFVDGKANYLLKDDAGSTTFGPLSGNVLVANFALTNADLTVYTYDVERFSGYSFAVYTNPSQQLPSNTVRVDFSQSAVLLQVKIAITPNNGALNNSVPVTLTTDELAEFLSTGKVVGKNVVVYSDPSQIANRFLATGGDSTPISTDFAVNTTTLQPFSENVIPGVGFGSVPLATDITWSDGFFIVNEAGTNRFYVSDVKSFTIPTLNFTSSEGDPDLVLALIVNNRDLYVFNERTTEIYANTGNADFPFERVQGGFIELGCGAQYSVAKIDGTICWLARSKDGTGQVYAMKGMSHQKISTHTVEQAIASYANPSKAVAYTYQSLGHKFYVLNFDEATWVYDLTTGLWHERSYTNDGKLERHRGQFLAFHPGFGIHFVGDYSSNKLYRFNENYYTDDGVEITSLRSSPHISNDLNRLFYSKFQLDMETGVGLDGGGQGSNPKFMLDWSDDGGHTWSFEKWTDAGRIGEYKARAIWRRLGQSRDRIFRVKITDPVKRVLIGAHIEIEGGSN